MSVQTEDVTITTSAGETMGGYLARPEGGGKRPAVLVFMEIFGVNDHIRDVTRRVAAEGYVAFALDMYGDGKTADHPKDAGRFAGEVRKNMAVGEKRFRAAMEFLQAHPGVDGNRIAAIGYWFGGGIVLEMARRGLPLSSVASFHGSLGGLSPVKPGMVKAKVLVLNGADDKFIKPEQIEQFKKDMDAAKADYEFVRDTGCHLTHRAHAGNMR